MMAGLFLVEVVERGDGVDGRGAEAQVGQALRLELRPDGGERDTETALQQAFHLVKATAHHPATVNQQVSLTLI